MLPELLRKGQRGILITDELKQFMESAMPGLANARVLDLKHAFGRRLRAAGVPLETRKVFRALELDAAAAEQGGCWNRPLTFSFRVANSGISITLVPFLFKELSFIQIMAGDFPAGSFSVSPPVAARENAWPHPHLRMKNSEDANRF
ncbi:MAG: hypothetical protein A3F73_10160 [Gallionellales bacterium RIFCSPLOWO2_12_FULL_59_22]|nr:MAG: hypothetical protein A2Z65_07605 [Gallionellales bacterium RIFCSPLOWO2_02_58_13]OGT10488.1 MAG: hypothetical protein A3F73_10160 [Gallionellales bacterium RIFCSPLOWO2_12_FULL_59_22]